MRKPVLDTDLRVKGLGLGLRFTLMMSAALLFVMSLAAYALYHGATDIAEQILVDTISRAVKSTADGSSFHRSASGGEQHPETGVQIVPGQFGDPPREGRQYRLVSDQDGRELLALIVPGAQKVGPDLLGMIAAIMVIVVVVGAVVAWWAGIQVTHPIQRILEDVRQIAKGDLQHRTHAIGGGEVELLARSIDRMTSDLRSAEHARVELSVREREMDLAAGVREALLPLTTPLVPGYELGALRLSSPRFAGDFHDFIERADGSVGLLVCDVSGQGVPAALVGATARSYLRAELTRAEDVGEAFRLVNRWLVADVRRGMYVTALYVLLEPERAVATVVCAGHKIPMLRYSRTERALLKVHPEGIAMGLDKGAVFDRRLEVREVALQKGDRLLLANSGAVAVRNGGGVEFGEANLFSRFAKYSELDTTQGLKALRRDLEQFAGEVGVLVDVSLVTLSREA